MTTPTYPKNAALDRWAAFIDTAYCATDDDKAAALASVLVMFLSDSSLSASAQDAANYMKYVFIHDERLRLGLSKNAALFVALEAAKANGSVVIGGAR